MALKEDPATKISIHALREEGDAKPCPLTSRGCYFYPRPPRGGRRYPDGWSNMSGQISIHALREEGDFRWRKMTPAGGQFLSTPSARRATAKTEKNISAFVSL